MYDSYKILLLKYDRYRIQLCKKSYFGFMIKRIDELRVIMADTSMHILAINETKIDNLVSDNEIRISGYNIIRKDRNRKGGVF